MKIVVIGDSHGNIANIKHVMGFAKNIKAGAVIHTGDWNTVESVNAVLEFQIPLYTILGNADINPEVEISLRNQSKKFDITQMMFKLDNRKIGVIHSFKASGLWYKGLDMVFCGHRHSQDERIINGVKIVRPGALVSGISFAFYDTVSNKVEFI